MVASGGVQTDRVGYATRWKALHGGYDPQAAAFPVRGWFYLTYQAARGLARIGVSPAASHAFAARLRRAVSENGR